MDIAVEDGRRGAIVMKLGWCAAESVEEGGIYRCWRWHHDSENKHWNCLLFGEVYRVDMISLYNSDSVFFLLLLDMPVSYSIKTRDSELVICPLRG